jgi:hypothetical protein
MEVTRAKAVASVRASRAGLTALAAVLVSALAACGGRAIADSPDSGGPDGAPDGSVDAGACDDSICDSQHPDCCGRCLDSTAQCPAIAPFCCGQGRFCYREPVEYPDHSFDRCYEKPLEGSIVRIDCYADDGTGRLLPELCPADHPYCCWWEEVVCADHPLFGYPCEPDQ